MADETFEDDIFDDLYDDEPASKSAAAATAPAPQAEPEPAKAEPVSAPAASADTTHIDGDAGATWQPTGVDDANMEQLGFNVGGEPSYDNAQADDDNYGPINVKEDGKMFIGGLNWETTEQSLKDYFSQFGEVSECTVMRDSATGRSRGFGFLTFKDSKCVNIVMVKEHYLDGKIIDPKRAIPREEQERTSKIFVGGVSQEATEEDFTAFFKQFGRVVDATLMMDKETGRPRGFGFVTFDGDAAVDSTLKQPLQILGKPIEVKRAQPRGNMRDDEEGAKKFGRGGGKFGNRGDNGGAQGGGQGGFDNGASQGSMAMGNGNMTPAMMAQYWQRMQQYFQQMQQSLAAQQQGGGMPGMGGMNMGMAGMNPMMAQMMAANMARNGSPNPQGMGGMNTAMMAQMSGGPGSPGANGNNGGNGAGGMGGAGGPRPGFNPQDQLAFEQQKYEHQQARRMQQASGYGGAGGPTVWEGMYDDAPQPGGGHGGHHGGGGGRFGKGNRGRQGSSQPPGSGGAAGGAGAGGGGAPINAPTGPKNAGRPGANYRGGGRGGAGMRFSPYGGRGG